MAHASARQNPQFNDLKPYVNPPIDARVRGVLMSRGNSRVQVIVPERALFDVQTLQHITKTDLRAEPCDIAQTTSAVPGYYEVPVVVDETLLTQNDLALTTTVPGTYLRTRGSELLNGYFETRTGALTISLSREPTQSSRVEDMNAVTHAVNHFTELTIQSRLDETLQIPPLPETARRIITLQADPHYDLRELTGIIETDPSIAARVMGWANSAFHNAKPPAKSIEDAVVRILGADTAMSMALGIAIGESLRLPRSQVGGLPPFWFDAVFCAATMEALARHIPASQRPVIGLCYLSGLLANFGTLVLGHVFPPYYATICALQEANRHLPHTFIDQQVLQLPREVVAGALLELWALPQEVSDAVRFQYANDYQGNNVTYVNLLSLARKTLGAQGLNDHPPNPLDEATATNLGLSWEVLSGVAELINESRDDLDGFARSMG
ncbi:MAG: HDOD domain-containing protein [Gammaproteobacteria bacterium]|nr:HDOD domain-containing protein [Gammaproteobacteria bacterium]